MTAARAIRRGIERPGLVSYFVMATAGALVVFAVAGYAARPARAHDEVSAGVMARQALLAVSNPVPGTLQVSDVIEGRREVVSVLVDGSAAHLDQVVVPAGTPATLVFSGDTECAASIEFADLDSEATADRDGTVSVDLPALPPGAYPFSCLRGCVSGVVLAQ